MKKAIVIVLVIVALGGVAWWGLAQRGSAPATQIPNNTFLGWKTYRNEQYGFEVKYPPQWTELKGSVSRDGEYQGKPLYIHYSEEPYKIGAYDAVALFGLHDPPQNEFQKRGPLDNFLKIGTADFSSQSSFFIEYAEMGGDGIPRQFTQEDIRKTEEILSDIFSCKDVDPDTLISDLSILWGYELCDEGEVKGGTRIKLAGKWAFFARGYPKVPQPPYVAVYEFLESGKYILLEVQTEDRVLLDQVLSTFKFTK